MLQLPDLSQFFIVVRNSTMETGGEYAERWRTGTNLVLLARDVAQSFADEAVHDTVRLVIPMSQLPIGTQHWAAKTRHLPGFCGHSSDSG